jgi:hypothetical protein
MGKMISKESDGKPQLPPGMVSQALAEGSHVAHILCDEPGAKVGDGGSVSFWAIVPFLPRAGDKIKLENGKYCVVHRAYWSVVRTQGDFLRLVPNVVAYLTEDKE